MRAGQTHVTDIALEFIGADVHRAVDDAGIAIEVGDAGDVAVVAGIEAGRVGLQVKSPAAAFTKDGSFVMLPGTVCRIGNGAAIVDRAIGIKGTAKIIGVGWGGVEIDDAVVQDTIIVAVESTSVGGGVVAGYGAIAQSAPGCSAAGRGSRVAERRRNYTVWTGRCRHRNRRVLFSMTHLLSDP